MREDLRDLWPDANALITWVRENHCHHAVENKEQHEYVARICGIPVGEMVVSHRSWGNAVVSNYVPPPTTVNLLSKDDVIDIDGFDLDDDGMNVLFNDVIPNKCPVCFHDSVDEDGVCESCGTDVILFNDVTNNDLVSESCLCPVCGSYVSEAEMMDDEKICRLCYGRQNHDMLERNYELKCDKCKKYVPITSFFVPILGVEYPKENKTCACCTVKRLDKEREEKENKQKSLDDYEDEKYKNNKGK